MPVATFENRHAAGVVYAGGRLVSTARVLSEGVCIGYLVDVWTFMPYRGRGIACGMAQRLLDRWPDPGLLTPVLLPQLLRRGPARLHTQLGHHGRHVVLHGLRRKVQPGRNFCVGQVVGQHLQHFHLARCQSKPVPPRGRPRPA
jgi:hypothetical protein